MIEFVLAIFGAIFLLLNASMFVMVTWFGYEFEFTVIKLNVMEDGNVPHSSIEYEDILQKAIDDEDYELAAKIKKEWKER